MKCSSHVRILVAVQFQHPAFSLQSLGRLVSHHKKTQTGFSVKATSGASPFLRPCTVINRAICGSSTSRRRARWTIIWWHMRQASICPFRRSHSGPTHCTKFRPNDSGNRSQLAANIPWLNTHRFCQTLTLAPTSSPTKGRLEIFRRNGGGCSVIGKCALLGLKTTSG